MYEQLYTVGRKCYRDIVLFNDEWHLKESHRTYLPLIEIAEKENPNNLYIKTAKDLIIRNIERLDNNA